MKTSWKTTATFTPAAAAYSAGDVMSTAQRITTFGPQEGGLVMLTQARLVISATGVISGETGYKIHFYSTTPPSAHADNDAWDLPAGDRSVYLGTVYLGIPLDIGSSLEIETTRIDKSMYVPAGGEVWAELETVGGFTATAVARTVTLHTVRL